MINVLTQIHTYHDSETLAKKELKKDIFCASGRENQRRRLIHCVPGKSGPMYPIHNVQEENVPEEE